MTTLIVGLIVVALLLAAVLIDRLLARLAEAERKLEITLAVMAERTERLRRQDGAA